MIFRHYHQSVALPDTRVILRSFRLVVVALFLSVNAFGSASIGEYLNRTNSIPEKPDNSIVTNAPVTTNTPPVVVTPPASGKETVIAQGSFTRPAIYVSDKVYIAAEGPKMGSVYYWVNGSGGLIVTASKQTALRTYIPDVVPNIVSWRYGIKDGGDPKCYGPGIYKDGKAQYSGPSKGAAKMAVSKDGVILISKNGEYKNLNTGKLGRYNMPDSGEKFDFQINGVWATAVNGFSKRSSYVSVNGKITTVADYAAYPDQSDDLCYPSVCINGKTVWFASVFKGKLFVNAVTDGKTRFPANNLPSIGDATMQDRCPPRLTVLNGRVTAFWSLKGVIYQADVENVLAGKGKPFIVCKGSMPDVHEKTMVYIDNGAVKTRGVGL
jgi:hypothetical protein